MINDKITEAIEEMEKRYDNALKSSNEKYNQAKAELNNERKERLIKTAEAYSAFATAYESCSEYLKTLLDK